jgi:hypothetical protein
MNPCSDWLTPVYEGIAYCHCPLDIADVGNTMAALLFCGCLDDHVPLLEALWTCADRVCMHGTIEPAAAVVGASIVHKTQGTVML